MITKSIQIEANVMVECEGKYCAGTKAQFNRIFGNWLPGDPDEISSFRVFINLHGQRIEISNVLSASERSVLASTFIDSCRAEESA